METSQVLLCYFETVINFLFNYIFLNRRFRKKYKINIEKWINEKKNSNRDKQIKGIPILLKSLIIFCALVCLPKFGSSFSCWGFVNACCLYRFDLFSYEYRCILRHRIHEIELSCYIPLINEVLFLAITFKS